MGNYILHFAKAKVLHFIILILKLKLIWLKPHSPKKLQVPILNLGEWDDLL